MAGTLSEILLIVLTILAILSLFIDISILRCNCNRKRQESTLAISSATSCQECMGNYDNRISEQLLDKLTLTPEQQASRLAYPGRVGLNQYHQMQDRLNVWRDVNRQCPSGVMI